MVSHFNNEYIKSFELRYGIYQKIKNEKRNFLAERKNRQKNITMDSRRIANSY